MKQFKWQGYEWITQERWGQVHPDKPHWWYDESCVSVDFTDCLHLTTKSNPKYFPELDVVSNIGVGLVSCTEKFGYGVFSIDAKLPKGEYLWPAFWLWSWDSWPPEIDVFEAYSNGLGNYFKPRITNPGGFWNIQSNVHYTDEVGNKMIGGKTGYMGFADPTKHFVTYTCVWQRDYIKFYYNGKLVREITDANILQRLEGTTMNVVINNGVTANVNQVDPPESDFIINSFRYSPILYTR
jgi:beta-glucanase (GH16 family)